MTTPLSQFIHDSLAKGLSRGEISSALQKAGWPEQEVSSALDMYADIAFPVPVPKRKPYTSAYEAFLYLVLFVCLYISAVSFGSLMFEFINTWFPDALPGFTDGSGARRALASLIVAFPLYLWLTSLFAKAYAKDTDKRGSKVRKWLSYLTLFIAAVVIIIDLITLLFYLLDGELTMRFVLKVITVLFIAGLIFGYYLWDLRKDEKAV